VFTKDPVANQPHAGTLSSLTRPEFYRLTETCRDYALDLAQYDQTRVNLQQCHKFNLWFANVKSFVQLEQPLRQIGQARPIARWQLLTLAIILGGILFLAFSARLPRLFSASFVPVYTFLLILFYFVPERFYGTTIEKIEGKVLRVVDTLDALLMSGELELTEAAFYRAKENLQNAREELRQQIDLAHRRWR
jgi:FtsZ-binding cell division protein ZapB